MSTEESLQTPQNLPTVSADQLPANLSNGDVSALLETVVGRQAAIMMNNFDGDRMNKWRLTALATGAECLRFGDLPPEPISVKYWYAHPVTIERKGGELVDSTRIVLITSDLDAYAFVSQGIAKGLGQIVSIWGLGPYSPPLRIRITQSDTKSGKIYNIVPADD